MRVAVEVMERISWCTPSTAITHGTLPLPFCASGFPGAENTLSYLEKSLLFDLNDDPAALRGEKGNSCSQN